MLLLCAALKLPFFITLPFLDSHELVVIVMTMLIVVLILILILRPGLRCQLPAVRLSANSRRRR
jgi:hypothetical protein